MSNFAQKLMDLEKKDTSSSVVPSAIFGTASTLNQSLEDRPPVRIGMWPVISEAEPEFAMAFMTLLAAYLERWQAVRVYRLFTNLKDKDINSLKWDISQSQFEVEDWHVEGLDENVGLWGTYDKSETDKWDLVLEIEKDDSDDGDEAIKLVYSSEDKLSLVNQLPTIAGDIVSKLAIETSVLEMPFDLPIKHFELQEFLNKVLEWEVKLSLALWGREMSEKEVIFDHEQLSSSAKLLSGGFAVWALSALTAHSMKRGFGLISETVTSIASNVIDNFDMHVTSARLISSALYRAGRVEQSYGLLETAVVRHNDDPSVWITLGELYRRGGRLNKALDTFQRAIENDAVNDVLFLRYASLLILINYQDTDVDTFVLCDVSALNDEYLENEIVEAYEEALKFNPKNRQVLLEQQIGYLAAIDAYERLWHQFEALVKLGDSGEAVRAAIDVFYDIPNCDPGLSTLRRYIEENPEDLEAIANLAAGYIADEQYEQAKSVLKKLKTQLTSADTDAHEDIAQLLLTADEPDLEMKLGEFGEIVNAGNTLSEDDVDYLEDIVERVPTLPTLYVVLAKAYQNWGEDDTALDTLVDGQQDNPNNPEIVTLLAEILWESDQEDLALTYLQSAIEAHPNNIILLVQTGQFLFEQERRDEARVFLARAEALAPRHPALRDAKVRIAEMLSDDNAYVD